MQYSSPVNYPQGTLRIIKKFLWTRHTLDYYDVPIYPKGKSPAIGGYDSRWLETTYILQMFETRYSIYAYWEDLVFFTIRKTKTEIEIPELSQKKTN